MPLITTTDYDRFYSQGESELTTEKNFFVDRYSIPLIASTDTYTLPDYVLSIRRVTYLGWKLDPLPTRNARDAFQSANRIGRPFWYLYNNIGNLTVKLFPAPEVTVAAGVTDLWGVDIPTCCIVEFFRATDNITFSLPSYLRRQTLKQYVNKRIAMIDGASGTLKEVQYFSQRWDQKKQEFVEFIDNLHTEPRKFVIGGIQNVSGFPGEPGLPIDRFGITVDEGY